MFDGFLLFLEIYSAFSSPVAFFGAVPLTLIKYALTFSGSGRNRPVADIPRNEELNLFVKRPSQADFRHFGIFFIHSEYFHISDGSAHNDLRFEVKQ